MELELVDEITEDLDFGGASQDPPFRGWASTLAAFYGAGFSTERRRSLARHLELCFHRAYSAGLTSFKE